MPEKHKPQIDEIKFLKRHMVLLEQSVRIFIRFFEKKYKERRSVAMACAVLRLPSKQKLLVLSELD